MGIVLGMLHKLGHTDRSRPVWAGASAAVVVSVAAGLALNAMGVAYGVHELQEAALLPTFVEHVWDMNHILDERGAVGTFLKALFGYNGNTSLLEVAAYGVYFAIVGIVSLRRGRVLIPTVETGS